MELRIDYGAMADPVEKQLNRCGYTLGNEGTIESIQQAVSSVNFLRINSYIPNSTANKVYQKIANRIGNLAKPLDTDSE